MNKIQAKRLLVLFRLRDRHQAAMIRCGEIKDKYIKNPKRLKKDGSLYKADAVKYRALYDEAKKDIEKTSHIYWAARKREKALNLAPIFKKHFQTWNSYEAVIRAQAERVLSA